MLIVILTSDCLGIDHQFVDAAVRKMLTKLESTKRMEYVNMYVNHVKILDNHLEKRGRVVLVFFKRKKAGYGVHGWRNDGTPDERPREVGIRLASCGRPISELAWLD